MSSSGRLSVGRPTVPVGSTAALDILSDGFLDTGVAHYFGKGTVSRFGDRIETVILREPNATEEDSTVDLG